MSLQPAMWLFDCRIAQAGFERTRRRKLTPETPDLQLQLPEGEYASVPS